MSLYLSDHTRTVGASISIFEYQYTTDGTRLPEIHAYTSLSFYRGGGISLVAGTCVLDISRAQLAVILHQAKRNGACIVSRRAPSPTTSPHANGARVVTIPARHTRYNEVKA